MAEGCVGCTGLRVRTVFGSGCTSLNLISDTPDLLSIIQQDDCTFRFSVTPPEGSFSAIHTIPSSTLVFFGNGTEATPLAAMVRVSADIGNIIQIRPDGLFAVGGGGGSLSTADNGLSLSSPTNVQLGGTLLHNTTITGTGFDLNYSGTGSFNVTGPTGNYHNFTQNTQDTYSYNFVTSNLFGPVATHTAEVEYGVNPGANRQLRSKYDTLLVYSSHGTLSQPFNDEKSYAHHHGVEFLTDPSPVALNFGGGTSVDVAFIVEQANMQIYGDTKQFIGTGWFANHYSRLMFDSPSGGSMQHFVDYVAGGYYMFGFTNTGNTVTNRYGMYIRDMSASPYTVVNKYSIYAEGANDIMYHNGNALFGTLVNTGQKLQVQGNAKISGIAAPSTLTYMVTVNDQGVLGSQVIPSGGGGGTPAGSNTEVQFNNAGVFGASPNFVYDGTAARIVKPSTTPGSFVYIPRLRVSTGNPDEEVSLGLGELGSFVYPRVLFKLNSTTSLNAGMESTLTGTSQMLIGMSNEGNYGGTSGTASGRYAGVYDFVAAVWRMGIVANGDMYLGASGGSFGVRMSQTGKTLLGTMTDSGDMLQVGGSTKFFHNDGELSFHSSGTPTLSLKRVAGSGAPVRFMMHWNNPTLPIYSIEASADTGEIRDFVTFGGFYKTFWSNGAEAMRLTTNKNLLVNTTTDEGQKLQVAGTATNNSLMKVGSLEFQPYAINNAWIGENVYYDGTAFKRRQTGFAGLFYFSLGEGQFRFDTNAPAGTPLSGGLTEGVIPFKMTYNGNVALGGDMTHITNDYTGATMVVTPASLILRGDSGTSANMEITNTRSINDLCRFQIRTSTGTNTGAIVELIPRGNGFTSNLKTRYSAFNTDFLTDGTNYEFINLAARGADFSLSNGKNGTGLARPIFIDATCNDSTVTSNIYFATNGNTIVGGSADNGEKFQVNGIGRIDELRTTFIHSNPLGNTLFIKGRFFPGNPTSGTSIEIQAGSQAPIGPIFGMNFSATAGQISLQAGGQYSRISIQDDINSPAFGGGQIIRGVYYNPTITSIHPNIIHNAFESTSGNWIVGGGGSVALNGGPVILSSTGAGDPIKIVNVGTVTGQGRMQMQPISGSNSISVVELIPKGTPGAGADISLYNTDFIADATNFDKLGIQANNAENIIYSYKGGTGTLKKIVIDATGGGSSTTANIIFQTNGNTLFGTTSDSGQKVQVAGKALVLATASTYSLEVQNADNIGAFISGVNGSGVEAQSQNSYAIGGVIIPSSTSSVDTIAKYTRSSSGTAANGIGLSLDLYNKTTVMNRLSNKIVSKWNDATDATRTSQYEIHGVNSASDTVLLTITGAGIFTLTQGLQNFANDAAAAGGGIPVNGLYRNGSVVQIRVT